MARIDDLLVEGIKTIGPKPPDDAPQARKNPWVGKLSNVIALAFAEELRHRGMAGARPAGPGDIGLSGAERRLAGGIGAKRVDVTWATEESGLLLACSIKTIMYRDATSGNFQKNLTNRRSDLLFETVTLHRRFPYAVLSGWLFLDHMAAQDDTARRKSTFANAFPRLRLFTGRADPGARDEQFEGLFVLLLDSNPFTPSLQCFEADDPSTPVSIDSALTKMVGLVAERTFDQYEAQPDGSIKAI